MHFISASIYKNIKAWNKGGTLCHHGNIYRLNYQEDTRNRCCCKRHIAVRYYSFGSVSEKQKVQKNKNSTQCA